MEMKVGQTVTEEMVTFVGGIVEDLGVAQGRVRALEENEEKAAAEPKPVGPPGDARAVAEDIRKELGHSAHLVDWKALFKKHKL